MATMTRLRRTATLVRVALLALGLVAFAAGYAGSVGTADAQVPVDTGKCRKAQSDARACRLAQPGLVDASGPVHLHEIYHADGTKVGEIYVAREGEADRYVEHWVMFGGYLYPSAIKPAADERYASERDFLARVPFGPGARYARWDVVEQTRIPGR